MSDKAKKTITFEHRCSDSYELRLANGVMAGILPQGQISLNFYLERPPLPTAVVSDVDEKGHAVPRPASDKLDNGITMERQFTSGVVLNVDTAKILIGLLAEQVKKVERRG